MKMEVWKGDRNARTELESPVRVLLLGANSETGQCVTSVLDEGLTSATELNDRIWLYSNALARPQRSHTDHVKETTKEHRAKTIAGTRMPL